MLVTYQSAVCRSRTIKLNRFEKKRTHKQTMECTEAMVESALSEECFVFSHLVLFYCCCKDTHVDFMTTNLCTKAYV